MNTYIVCLAVGLWAPAVESPIYTPQNPAQVISNTVIRGQSLVYDEVPMGGGAPGSSISDPRTTAVTPPIQPTPEGMPLPPGSDPFRPHSMGQQYPGGMSNNVGMRYGANGPQPYRMNQWVSRYSVGILPKESTEKGLGKFGSVEFDAEWDFVTPIAPGLIGSLTPQYSLRSWDGPEGSAMVPTVALPGSVHRVGLDFGIATPANNYSPLSIKISLNPSINSDFERGLSSDAWQLDGHGMLFYKVDPRFTWVFGAGFWDRVKDRVIPYAGFIWTPDDRWEWRMVLPNPRLSYFMGQQNGMSTWAYIRGEYHVESYQIELETTGAREKVELEDWRVMLGLRFDNGFHSSFIEAGWVLGRDVRFLHGTPGFDVGNGFIGRVGIQF